MEPRSAKIRSPIQMPRVLVCHRDLSTLQSHLAFKYMNLFSFLKTIKTITMKNIISTLAAILAAGAIVSAQGPGTVTSDLTPGNYIQKTTYTSADGSTSMRDVTYYDGLGYPVQEVSVGASPTGRHIVRPIVYDNMRRDNATVYLPYAAPSGSAPVLNPAAITSQAAFYADLHSDAHPFSVNTFEPWKEGRLTSSRREGDAWASADRRSTLRRHLLRLRPPRQPRLCPAARGCRRACAAFGQDLDALRKRRQHE